MEACLRAVGEEVANEAGLRQERINKMQIHDRTGEEKSPGVFICIHVIILTPSVQKNGAFNL